MKTYDDYENITWDIYCTKNLIHSTEYHDRLPGCRVTQKTLKYTELAENKPTKPRNYLPTPKQRALKALKQDKEINLKKADKLKRPMLYSTYNQNQRKSNSKQRTLQTT